jgi:hypothetical protein
MIRVGGGYERFQDYVPENHKNFQRQLVGHMVNNNKPLDWVLKQLIDGKKIRTSTIDRLLTVN